MLQLGFLHLMTREKLNVLRGVEERDKHGTRTGQVVVAVYEEEVEVALRTYPVGVVIGALKDSFWRLRVLGRM